MSTPNPQPLTSSNQYPSSKVLEDLLLVLWRQTEAQTPAQAWGTNSQKRMMNFTAFKEFEGILKNFKELGNFKEFQGNLRNFENKFKKINDLFGILKNYQNFKEF